MSCSLNTLAGIAGSCESNQGGIIEVYINHFDQVEEVTVTSDKISAIALKSSGEKFHVYNFKRNTGSLTSTYTIDPANGVSFVTSELSLVFAKQDTAKRIEISALALDDLVVIVKDANGKYWYLGYNEPVQASAATMAITLMLFDMHIPGFGFELAAALAMGQNIGTTITAFMASLTANTQAKRAALAHMFFNVFGVVVVLIIFYPFCQFVSWFVEDILHNSNNPLFRLSAFHTFFNIGNTLLLIGFVKQIKELVCKVLPLKEENEEYRLRYISGGLLSTAELSILQARKEIVVFAQRCRKMLDLINGLLNTEKGQEFNSIFTRIEKYEQITDSMDLEIAKYLNQVSEGRLSDDSKMQILQMLRTVSELESIGDSFFNMGRTLNRKREYTTEDFTDKQYEHINNMLTLVKKALDEMVKVVSREEGIQIDYHISYNIENEINNYRNQLKNQNIVDINNNVYSYQIGTFYIDFISECEKLGDYILNVIQSSSGEKLKV